MTSVIISTWGDPLRWQVANYACHKDLGKSGVVKGNTTMVCYGHNDVVVLVSDSVLSSTVAQPVYHEAFNCYNQILSGGGLQQCSDLDCWRRLVKEYINCVVKSTGFGGRVHVIPVAAIGTYGSYKFGGWPEAVQVDALAQLAGYARGLSCPRDGHLELLVDLTHGVNYLPTVVLGLVLDFLAPLLAIRCEAQVLVKAYYAVPVGGNQYEFHKVFSQVVKRFEPPGGRHDKVLKAFLTAMPLAMVKTCAEFEAGEVSVSGSVSHPSGQQLGEVKYFTKPSKIADVASMLLAEEICAKVKGVAKGNALEINSANSLFSAAAKFAGDLARITEVEVNAVYDTVTRSVLLNGQCARLCELKGGCRDLSGEIEKLERGERPDNKLVRNFLAHGGLLEDFVKVCNKDGKRLISYVDEKDSVELAKLIDAVIEAALGRGSS